MSDISKADRVRIVTSGVWLFLVGMSSGEMQRLREPYIPHPPKEFFSITDFLLFGILPVGIYWWGYQWIRRGK